MTENIAVQLKEDGVECSLRGETYLKGVGDVTTYWVNAESLLGDCSSSSSSDGPDNQFYELGNGVMGLPRKKSLLFPVSELQEVIAEEEELPDEDSIQNGSFTFKLTIFNVELLTCYSESFRWWADNCRVISTACRDWACHFDGRYNRKSDGSARRPQHEWYFLHYRYRYCLRE